MPFGILIGAYIIINEGISIAENIYECGVKIPFVGSMLKAANDKMKRNEEEKKDGE